jgi:nicotinamide mononucleotide adenylyltransferase
MNSFIKESINGNLNRTMVKPWFPDTLNQSTTGNVQLKLLCGADLLESFSVPGLWKDEDVSNFRLCNLFSAEIFISPQIEAIVGQHGIVVVSRSGSNPEQFIFNSDLLSKYRHNITLVTNWVANEVSSTLVRRLFRRNMSVKYLLDDSIIDYVKRNGLYGSADHT